MVELIFLSKPLVGEAIERWFENTRLEFVYNNIRSIRSLYHHENQIFFSEKNSGFEYSPSSIRLFNGSKITHIFIIREMCLENTRQQNFASKFL